MATLTEDAAVPKLGTAVPITGGAGSISREYGSKGAAVGVLARSSKAELLFGGRSLSRSCEVAVLAFARSFLSCSLSAVGVCWQAVTTTDNNAMTQKDVIDFQIAAVHDRDAIFMRNKTDTPLTRYGITISEIR